jgi:UDP-N-acetylmuramoyl-L-alanyl-D-glutamate--2,6-diaminopimelate ligase
MGEVAGALADWTIVTSDNPRSEDPLAIISDIERGIKKTGPKNYKIIPDREKAIEQALSMGEKGDHVLVAGKGHENYQILKEKTIHFDDAEVIRKILEKRSKPRSG